MMKQVLTVKEVAGVLKCNVKTVYALYDTGQIKGFRVAARGKRGVIRIYAENVEAFMKRNENVCEQMRMGTPPSPPEGLPPQQPKGKRRRTGRSQSIDDVLFIRMDE